MAVFHFSLSAQVQHTENYGLNDGITHPYVLSILKDSKGFIWIGTYNGLVIYDGYSFRELKTIFKDTGEVRNVRVVYDIIEDENDVFWIGTEAGLIKYNRTNGGYKRYLHSESDSFSISHNHIRKLLKGSDSCLYIGTYGFGLNKMDIERGRFISYMVQDSLKHGLPDNNINALLEDFNSKLWIGTEKGLCVFDMKSGEFDKDYFEKIQVSDAVNYESVINTFYQDYFENIWIGTWDKGLVKYDQKTQSFLNYIKSHKDGGTSVNNVRAIIPDDADHLWLGSFGGGLNYFNSNSADFTFVDFGSCEQNDKINYDIWSMAKDLNNNLWLGSFGKGIYQLKINKNEFSAYFPGSADNTLNDISSIYEDKDKKVWVGTSNGNIYNFNTNNKEFKLILNIGGSVQKITEGHKSNIWVVARNAIFQLSPSGKVIDSLRNDTQNPVIKGNIQEIFEDSYGVVWIGSWGGGISWLYPREDNKLSNAKIVNLPVNQADLKCLSHHVVTKIYEDRRGDVWIGTADSLNVYSRKTGTFRRLDYPSTHSFYEDKHGNMWIGGALGLVVLDKDKKQVNQFAVAEGFENITIQSAVRDNLGNFWMGSINGLIKVEAGNNLLQSFTVDDGLPSNFFNRNSACFLASGELIFGTNNGLILFNSEHISSKKEQLNVSVIDFRLQNKSVVYEINNEPETLVKKPITSVDSIQLSYTDNVFSIEFAAINAKYPEKIIYRYKLEGFDKDWVTSNSKNRVATYTNLVGGTYVFKVQASYRANIWDETIDSLTIIITPPIWKRAWFIVSISLFLLSMMVLLIFLRIKKERAKMAYTQKTTRSETLIKNLTKDLELLSRKNKILEYELGEKNKTIASKAVNVLSFNEKIEKFISYLYDLKERLPNEHQSKINKVLKSLKRDIDKIKEDSDFNENFNLLYDDFQKRLSGKYPKLTQKDVKICAFIRMGKSNVEIAGYLNISPSSVGISRYRIRQKIGLAKDTRLNDFVLRF